MIRKPGTGPNFAAYAKFVPVPRFAFSTIMPARDFRRTTLATPNRDRQKAVPSLTLVAISRAGS